MADISNPDIESIISSYDSSASFTLPSNINTSPTSSSPPQYKSGYVPYSNIEPATLVPISATPPPEIVPISASPYSEIITTPSNRSFKVTHIDFAPFLSNAGVRGVVTNVSHGTFHSRPSTLIVLSFSLRSGEHGFRFKAANIKITFAKHPSAPQTDASPAVVKFAPRKIYGLPTVEGKKNTIGGELTLQVPAGPLTFGPSIKGEQETEYEKQYRYKTVGNFWSSKQGTDWDIVYWDIKENKRTGDGIPDRVNVGVIVEREGSFVATVEVTIDTPFMNGAFSHPWTKNNPATFVPGIVMGPQPKFRKFELLGEEDWRRLVPYEEEWENKLTDEALYVAQRKGRGGSNPVVVPRRRRSEREEVPAETVEVEVEVDSGYYVESDDR